MNNNILAINGGFQSVPIQYQDFKHPRLSPSLINWFAEEDNLEKVTVFKSDSVLELQKEFQKEFQINHALLTNSGTSAIFTMFYSLGLKENDEVLVPVYTFFATATPLFVLGCKPILIDCLENGNIDPFDLEKKITKNTKAIIITHMWGIPCNMDEILELVEKYNIPLLEDASHAHGATYNNQIVGTFGVAGAWSLGAKKIITGGQGGVICTKSREFYERSILLTQANNKEKNEVFLKHLVPYSKTGIGLNLRIHPFSVKIISEQLKDLNNQLNDRRYVADFFIKEISKIKGLTVPKLSNNANPSWYAFPVLYDEKEFNIPKNIFIDALIAEGATGADIPESTCPLTEFSAFSSGEINIFNKSIKKIFTIEQFPGALKYQKCIFKLPTWYGENCMDYAEEYIQAIKKVILHIDSLK